MKEYVHMKFHSWMFTAALTVVARNWKQPKCPSRGEWINEMGNTHTLEYFSATEMNQLFICARLLVNLKMNMLSDRSQTATHKKKRQYILYDSIYVKF